MSMGIDVPISLAVRVDIDSSSSAACPAAAAAVEAYPPTPIALVSASSRRHPPLPPRDPRKHLPVIGLFSFYVGHDALQERMFRYDGYEYGFFMTLAEVIVMLVMSIITDEGGSASGIYATVIAAASGGRRRTRSRRGGGGGKGEETLTGGLGPPLSMAVLVRIMWVGILLALAHGLGNTSLNYSPYPLKVAFKSCKLVPTMSLGACFTGRKHTGLQYTAALVMGMGLAMLTAADVFSAESMTPGMLPAGSSSSLSARHVGGAIGPFIGPILLAVSTIIDSIIPNLQEQLLQIAKVKTSAMILVSNAIMCIVLLAYTAYTGELAAAYGYCAVHRDASGVLFVQGICAYLGLRCYLAIIREHGGVVGVLMANARKVLTIVLSFVLFSKPFHRGHFLGLALVCSGVYLGSKKAEKKKGPTTRRDGVVVVGRGTQSSTDEKRGEEATDRHHEHSV